ncbi:AAA family ATPase [Nitrosococcus halophilus]|uniref:AAA family ATPase n=1 Tax=Nitrosococcus halophilus TaxID=133539 RepID=UPI00059D172E
MLDEKFKPREELLAPWLTQRHLSMVYAPAGVGKSWFALSAALAVAGGGKLYHWDAPIARRVVFVDGEMDIEDLQERCEKLIEPLDVNIKTARNNLLFLAQQDQSLDVEFPDLATDEGQAIVMKHIKNHRAEFVILDNFSTLCEVEDENAASSFNPIMRFLRQLKQGRIAAMLVHHARKNTSGNGSYRGTSKQAVIFNSIISLNHPDRIPAQGGATFDIDFEKYRGLRDDRVAPVRVSLQNDPGERPQWVVEPRSDAKIVEMVRAVKELACASQDELAERFGVTKGTISKWKRRAIDMDLVSSKAWEECLKEAQQVREEEEHAVSDVSNF